DGSASFMQPFIPADWAERITFHDKSFVFIESCREMTATVFPVSNMHTFTYIKTVDTSRKLGMYSCAGTM
ncbi:hypothetical protein, partial [Enterobacter hormaechei]|uniref:hypothetical protein n=1 Tax=Enterobacter hormaechei TaxID=158836 RepID=UPI001C8DB805